MRVWVVWGARVRKSRESLPILFIVLYSSAEELRWTVSMAADSASAVSSGGRTYV